MWNVELVDAMGLVIDCFSVDDEEVTVDDIAKRNWCLGDGDTIRISNDERRMA